MNWKLIWNEYNLNCKRWNCSSAAISDFCIFSPIMSSNNIKCYMRNKPVLLWLYADTFTHTCTHHSVCVYIYVHDYLFKEIKSIRTQTLWLLPASFGYFKRYLQLLGGGQGGEQKTTQQWKSEVPASVLRVFIAAN